MKWVLSIVGVVFIGVVFDLLLPDGKATKFCRAIFGVVLLFVLLTPLGDLFGVIRNISLDYESSKSMSNINLSLVASMETEIEKCLETNGYSDVQIMISANTHSSEIKIYKIFVDMSVYVLNCDDEHTIDSSRITNLIIRTVSVDEGDIIIYGY